MVVTAQNSILVNVVAFISLMNFTLQCYSIIEVYKKSWDENPLKSDGFLFDLYDARDAISVNLSNTYLLVFNTYQFND